MMMNNRIIKRVWSGWDTPPDENPDGDTPIYGITAEYECGEVHTNAIEVYTTEADRDLIIQILNLDNLILVNSNNDYMIGQRVIYQNVICVVCRPDDTDAPDRTWVHNPSKGYKHWVSKDNLKPLPGGQL